MEVLIVGGSLSGLFTGIALKSLPAETVSNVTILERYSRDGKLTDAGAGIACGEEVLDAITKHVGVLTEDYAIQVRKHRFLSRDSHAHTERPIKTWTTSWGQLYRVFKQCFDADPKCSYRHSCTLVAIETIKDEPRVKVEFENEQGYRESLRADLVIGADGPSSKVRSLLLPQVTRTTTGYVCYRGLVPESVLSPDAKELYDQAATGSLQPTSQFLTYLVPGNEEAASRAKRFVNWVWYRNRSDEAMSQLMTDKKGRAHKFSLPQGNMKDEEIDKLRAEAHVELPALQAELIDRTGEPFVQVITDSITTQNCFHDGKLLLVGDAVGGQRPHTASAVAQGIYHGLLVRRLLQDEISLQRRNEQTQRFSSILVTNGLKLGKLIMADDEVLPGQKPSLYVKMYSEFQKEMKEVWKTTMPMPTPMSMPTGNAKTGSTAARM